MVIYRAGLTGCLAGVIIPNSDVLDLNSGPVLHKAVLRFRSDEISKATGIPFEKIKVTKAVFDGEMFVPWNPCLANEYSMKVIDGLYDRSIENLEPVTRWLAPDNFHEQLIDILGEKITWDVTMYPNPTFTSVPVISTLDMPANMRLVGAADTINLDTHFNSIYVTTIYITVPSGVHQTVYFPSPDTDIYRVTLEGSKMIIESRAAIEEDDWKWIPGIFGLPHNSWTLDDSNINYRQRIGKIAPVRDDLRKEIIGLLTENHNLYSLGRTAIWKNILLDDCLQDIHQIQRMIHTPKYDRMLGR